MEITQVLAGCQQFPSALLLAGPEAFDVLPLPAFLVGFSIAATLRYSPEAALQREIPYQASRSGVQEVLGTAEHPSGDHLGPAATTSSGSGPRTTGRHRWIALTGTPKSQRATLQQA
ncbi:hypothetical protein FVEG_16111 [Fusarium verticillioides 7600]|uniref:Uncharacterized protein n=1 Tax=Gibberella moniliformis (strain M3125 / FGSC 7600) TaxID=334819 RepID=W7MRV7_GIBM7|nr:hypothetical protein FVEG_16111 [Fusarium verticillioides 7600]EWG47322.1 hypothetical protein FVEG_16111 [Fusarium verticillioides 7600]